VRIGGGWSWLRIVSSGGAELPVLLADQLLPQHVSTVAVLQRPYAYLRTAGST
jgi:hypothetical protein